MTTLIVLGVIAALLTVVLATKVGARVSFGESFRLWLVVGFVKKEINLNGESKSKPKKESEDPPKEKAEEKPVEESKVPSEDKPETEQKDEPEPDKTSFLDNYDKKKLFKFGVRALKSLLKLPRIDILELNYIAGGTEADKIAVSYGRMCAAVGAAVPFINNFMRVKRWHITTNMDFTSPISQYSGCVQVTVTIGAVVAFGLWALIEFLKCRTNKKS